MVFVHRRVKKILEDNGFIVKTRVDSAFFPSVYDIHDDKGKPLDRYMRWGIFGFLGGLWYVSAPTFENRESRSLTRGYIQQISNSKPIQETPE